MKDSTINLVLTGILAIGGLVAATAVTLTGMAVDWSVEQILAVNVVFSNVVMAALAFFFGHRNGFKNGQRNAESGGRTES